MPSHTLKPYPLHTTPKPHAHYQELTDAEYAAFGRAFLSLDAQERQAYQRLLTARQRKNQLIAETVAKVGGDFEIEEYSECHLHHEGPCNV